MTDRELMQQALKALDWISRAKAMDYEYRIKANEVLPALRARLAHSSEMDEAIAAGDGTLHGAIDYWQERALKAEARLAQKPEQTEPVQPNEVLFAVEIPEGYEETHLELLGEDVFAGKQWVRWRVVPTDEPSAEPVAYRYRYIDGWIECQPLYTSPPPRTPLTDETLWEMWVESPSDVLRFARAIERAHGIGEKK